MEETKTTVRGKSALPPKRSAIREFEKSLRGIMEDPRIKLGEQTREKAKKKKQQTFAENRKLKNEDSKEKIQIIKEEKSIFDIIRISSIPKMKERIMKLWMKTKQKLLNPPYNDSHERKEIENHITMIGNTIESWDPEIAGYKALCEKQCLGIPTGLVLILDTILSKFSPDTEDRQMSEPKFEFNNQLLIDRTEFSKYQKTIDQLLIQIKSLSNNNHRQKEEVNKKKEHISYYWMSKAILYDKYRSNRGRVITKNNNIIKTYDISVNYINNYKIFYIKYNHKWIKLRNIIEKLNAEGLIYGFKNILKSLRMRNKNRYNGRENFNEELSINNRKQTNTQ